MLQELGSRISLTMKNLLTMKVQIPTIITTISNRKSAPLLLAVLTSNLRGELRADWEKTRVVRGSSSNSATASSSSFSIKKIRMITMMWLLCRTVKIYRSLTSNHNSSLKRKNIHLSLTINKWTTKIITAILTIKTQINRKISLAALHRITPYNYVTKYLWLKGTDRAVGCKNRISNRLTSSYKQHLRIYRIHPMRWWIANIELLEVAVKD